MNNNMDMKDDAQSTIGFLGEITGLSHTLSDCQWTAKYFLLNSGSGEITALCILLLEIQVACNV